MRVTITGATGRVGGGIVAALQARGDEVTVLSRSPDRAAEALGTDSVGWQPEHEPAPAAALAGRDAVVHLAGEDVAQRWDDDAKRRLLASRELGTRNLVAGLRAADPRPGTLVSSSAVGYYGPHGDEPVTEETPAGDDFLAGICVAWEREAAAAEELGVRVVRVRTGVVLDREGGALQKMLPFFKLGIGGPVAGGRQWLVVDPPRRPRRALRRRARRRPLAGRRSTPPRRRRRPTGTSRTRSAAPCTARRSPPCRRFAIRVLYGEMAAIVVNGQRAVPERPLALGYAFRHSDLDGALRDALSD